METKTLMLSTALLKVKPKAKEEKAGKQVIILMEDDMFQEELEFFKANQINLVGQYGGKVLVIKGKKVIGVYNTTIEAFNEAIKEYKPGEFMIQPCEPGPEAYTVTISSSELFIR